MMILFRKFLVFSFMFISTGCGSGGSDNTSQECRTYCQLACAKIANCENYNYEFVEECKDGCPEKAEENGATPESCTKAAQAVVGATCAQLERLFGFADLPIKPSLKVSQIAPQCSDDIAHYGSTKK